MTTWSEVLEARTNERGDLIARIRPEISRGLRNQWYKFDEEAQYSIVAEMLEPYGFRKGAGWYNWVFIKDGAKFQMMQNDVTQLQDGHWIFVSRVELAQWEKEHVEKHWGLLGCGFSGNEPKLREICKDIMLYYGVTEEDIKTKSERFSSLVLELCL